MNHPLISIIVPIYNVEQYLEQCIESIISQTNELRYVEVILVDDCSPDGSGEKAEKYGRLYDCIKVIHHQSNQGLSIARNSGINEANGSWIWFVDSDDWIDKDSLIDLIKMIKENESCDVICIQKKHIRQERSYVKNKIPSPTIMSGRQYLRSNLQKTCAPKFIVKREFLLNKKLFFYPHILHEDILYCFMLLYYAEKVYVSEKPLYLRRMDNPGNIINTIGIKNANDMIIIHRELMDFWNSRVEPEDKEWFFKNSFSCISTAYRFLDRFCDVHAYSDFQAKNKKYIKEICKMATRYSGTAFKMRALVIRFSPHYLKNFDKTMKRVQSIKRAFKAKTTNKQGF